MSLGVITPTVVARACRSKLQTEDAEITVLWVEVPGARDEFEAELRHRLLDAPATAITIRERGFDDPNSLLADLVTVLNQAQSKVLLDYATAPDSEAFGIVLLAKTPLTIAQASSPILLPEWFPRHGGKTVSMEIHDITRTATLPLNASESKVDELCVRLFQLEAAVLRRFRGSQGAGIDLADALGMLFTKHSDTSAALLEGLFATHESVRTPSGYRPSTAAKYSFSGQVWRFVRLTAPESLTPMCGDLRTALELPTQAPRKTVDSLASVLSRPTQRTNEWGTEFCRNLLHLISTTCQFVTAAAHSDAYGEYPVQLLAAYSHDLRRSMADAENLLNVC